MPEYYPDRGRGCSDIFDAIKAGDLQAVKDLLRKNPSLIHTRGENSDSMPLHEASAAGNKEIGMVLISYGAEINAEARCSTTPLHWAAARGNSDMAELLISHGALIDARTCQHASTVELYHGESTWFVEGIPLLLPVEEIFPCSTPLMLAAQRGNKEVAELLIAKGAAINAQNGDGSTPLHSAAGGGHCTMAELLILKGAHVNARNSEGQTPLKVADTDEMRALLSRYGAVE